MDFEWDEAKRQTNIRKRGIDFIDAVRVFDGVIVTKVDNRFDYGEVRQITTGVVAGVVTLTLVHTDRQGRTRLISARLASPKERQDYETAIRSSPDT